MKQAVKSENKKNKLLLFVMLSIAIIIFSGIFSVKASNAYATTSANPVGEIWDSTSDKFNQKVVEKLYTALGGSNVTGTDFQDKFTCLKNWASSPKTSQDFRNNNGSSNVIVTLGGKQWVATYLTQAGGNLVLTLMLADVAINKSNFNSFCLSI